MKVSMKLETDSDNSYAGDYELTLERSNNSLHMYITLDNPTRIVSVKMVDLKKALLILGD